MNTIRNSAVVTALVLLLGLALPVAAQGAYGGVDTATKGTVELGTTRIGANADVDVKVDADVKTSGSAGINVQAEDVDGDGVAGMAATGTVHGDPDFDLLPMKAESSEDGVTVTSRQRAKLFGFIPVTVDATATVNADGSVEVSYPWYAFLMVTNKAELKAKLQDRVDSTLGAQVNANARADGNANIASSNASATGTAQANANAADQAAAKLTAGAQARLVQEVKAVLQAEFDAAVNASSNARVNKIDGMTVKQ